MIELSKQSYNSIMEMPVDRFHNYFKWKNKFDEEVEKAKENAMENLNKK